MALPVYLGLVHYPIYNKNNEIVTTAITNFDIHDIARTARTYDLLKYFIIHPLDSQKALAEEIINYWQEGYGGQYNPDRKEALSIVEVIPDIAAAVDYITAKEGAKPLVVTTDARKYANTVSYIGLRQEISDTGRPCLLLFGTGWGMENSVMQQFDYILEPIYGPGSYNHLPVRAAVAIILDRLLGEFWWKNA
ncbi:RNA methyltransferase [Sporomusa sp.]|uniref:RNA methyltransferase n=1 Tax=Sporomusa sp. TaxID=2078658 RepID=UPI002BE349B0|nr:RNA methyltransferase [Sporomusa sp.]HWR43197.1 RNA methyltransferase [Sporomusa sp.]